VFREKQFGTPTQANPKLTTSRWSHERESAQALHPLPETAALFGFQAQQKGCDPGSIRVQETAVLRAI
jgi:hypothetical protein